MVLLTVIVNLYTGFVHAYIGEQREGFLDGIQEDKSLATTKNMSLGGNDREAEPAQKRGKVALSRLYPLQDELLGKTRKK